MPDWREITAGDCVALQAFTCTSPAKKVYEPGLGKTHPFPHELEVQSYVRDLHPPKDGETISMLRFDGSSIASVGCLNVARTDDLELDIFLIQVVAVQIEYRGRGYGDEAVQKMLEIAAATNAKYNLDSPIAAKIHVLNTASQELFRRNGFERDVPLGEGLEQWISY